jgi:hypothetical protein
MIGGVIVGIVVSGVMAADLLSALVVEAPWLFAWLWFNLFIAVYEFYVVAQWRYLKHCPRDFWKEPVENDSAESEKYGGFWLKAWAEYACEADRRYLADTSGRPNFVYWIEFGNAIWVVLLWIAFLMQQWSLVGILLILQAYHCGIYFLSWAYDRRAYGEGFKGLSYKAYAYLALSALWIVIPVLLYLWGWGSAPTRQLF